MSRFDDALAAAAALPIGDQARLIDAIWANAAPPLSQAWREEIARRSAELDAGAAQTVAWSSVRDEALRRLDETAAEAKQNGS
ncbi:addiction module protein [Botrimarina sp.]|uniref:addiction module protein n=1 Tax=Botrimarina sp. TaxID=2795802 RepID=UPI0032F02561